MVEEKQTPPPPAGPEPAAVAAPWYNPLLNFFSSVHVAVVILILLATISIIGTVLQQENIGDVGDNLRLYQQFFGDAGRAQRAFDISEKIGFFNLYHTWYFYTLLLLLSTSLIVCSLRRHQAPRAPPSPDSGTILFLSSSARSTSRSSR